MDEITSQDFVCQQCGACCRIPGLVHLRTGEPAALADRLGMEVWAFTERYTTLSADRCGLVLIDKPDGSCCLLDQAGNCQVHDVKPQQCREFPFVWTNEDSATICPGLRQFRSPQPRIENSATSA